KGSAMHAIHYRNADVDGHRLFCREAGAAGAPAVVLLHGLPASSFMFRNLIPLLADRCHVIAPDYLGFGLSDAPAAAAHAPSAEICLLDGGHFLLENHLDATAGHVRTFLERAPS